MRFQIFHLHLLCCCPPSKYMSWPKRRAGQKQKQAVLLVASWKTCQVAQTDCQKMFHLYCRCYQNIQKSNNPSSWSEQQPIHGNCARHSSYERIARGITSLKDCSKMWDLPIHGIPKRKKKTLQGDEMSVLMAKVTGFLISSSPPSSQTQQVATFFLAEETLHTAWWCLSSGFPTWKFSRIAIRS